MFFILFSVNVVMMLIMVRKVIPIFVQHRYLFIRASKTIQPMPYRIPMFFDRSSLIQQHHLISSQWLQPKHFNQCLIPIVFYSMKTCQIFIGGSQNIQMPGSKILLHYNVTCYLLIDCSQDILKVHKNENFFGFDFEFCPISLLVMHK